MQNSKFSNHGGIIHKLQRPLLYLSILVKQSLDISWLWCWLNLVLQISHNCIFQLYIIVYFNSFKEFQLCKIWYFWKTYWTLFLIKFILPCNILDIVFDWVYFTLQYINQLLNTGIKSSLLDFVVCHEIDQWNHWKYGLIHRISSNFGHSILKIVDFRSKLLMNVPF